MSVEPGALLDFGARHRWHDEAEPSTLVRIDGAPLALPSGRLVFCDPLWQDLDLVVRAELKPGVWQTVFSALVFPRTRRYPDGLRRLAAAAVGDISQVAQWRRALDPDGQEVFFSVDSASGCLFDLQRAKDVRAALAEPGAVARLTSATFADLVFPLEHESRLVAAAFDCGMGAGGYRVFEGLDSVGEVVAVLADLELLSHAVQRL